MSEIFIKTRAMEASLSGKFFGFWCLKYTHSVILINRRRIQPVNNSLMK